MLMDLRGNWTVYLKGEERVVGKESRGIILRRRWERWGKVALLHSGGSKV